MNRRMKEFLAFGVFALGIGAGCGGGSYQPSRAANFQIDAEAEIDDDDIRKAFDARPQMPSSAIRLSYYTFDPQIADDLDKSLATMPGVSSVYRIPPLLVTGQRRFQDGNGHYGPTPEVSVKKLRLLAARAKTDVLVIVDHGYQNTGINPLVSFSMLLFPLLFVPFLDTHVKGYVETFVIDVRNGYLYGHLVQEDQRGEHYVTIYGKKFEEYQAEQWKELRTRFGKDLAGLLEAERNRKEPETNKAVAAPQVILEKEPGSELPPRSPRDHAAAIPSVAPPVEAPAPPTTASPAPTNPPRTNTKKKHSDWSF
jgi:hypothetical protein